MRSIEQTLVRLDEFPMSAVWRALLGSAIPPVFAALLGSKDGAWAHMALLLCLLAGLRVGPAVLRFTLPISSELKEIWRKRRFIAKEHDSYQWQKLFWMGLGMLPHGMAGEGLGSGGLAVAAFCLVGGGIGLIAWSRVGTPAAV